MVRALPFLNHVVHRLGQDREGHFLIKYDRFDGLHHISIIKELRRNIQTYLMESTKS